MPDGSEVRTGPEPRPLCEGCPERVNPRRPVLHVEVRLDYRNRFDGGPEVAPSGATLPSVGHGAGPEKHGRGIASADISGSYPGPETARDAPTAPEPDGLVLPAAWGPSHPERLIAEGREPEPPRRSFAGHEGTPGLRPEDFGLTP
jgi:hypothetical protein